MRIYVAGPYSNDDPEITTQNVERAMVVGRELLRQGHAPFIPHLNHWFDPWTNRRNKPVEYEEYMRWGASFLEVCDGVVLIGSSPGADREIELARQLGIPIISRFSCSMLKDAGVSPSSLVGAKYATRCDS